jgi:histidinol dehydrogenase
MNVFEYPKAAEIVEIIKRPTLSLAEMIIKVKPIVEAVKTRGDAALREFALDFDNILLNDFAIDPKKIEQAGEQISPALKAAIDQAYSNIYRFHAAQKKEEDPIETMPGVLCWRKSVAIEKVGIYIPGGTAPLFSTVLMLGIPAQIAGCKNIVLCSPSSHPAIFYAAQKVGVTALYRLGGAQAIAALAFGTESIPKVDKIFGPGNQFVTAAKQLVNQMGTAIDMPAGPSEVAIFADHRANAHFVAADLLSQAEHGIDSQVLMISTSKVFIDQVLEALNTQLNALPRMEMAAKALENSKAVLVHNEEEAAHILNQYAAEHLILALEDPEHFTKKIYNAGSIFLGDYTPESCGDYASGTNHTLPTNGHAKAYSGVSVDSFVKKITYQKISKAGIQNIGPLVEIMAEAEELFAHKNAVTLRLNQLK